ncbi:MAG: hypothetical protein ACE5KJ_04770 [Candidatus Zixiibacteriota bacterium]
MVGVGVGVGVGERVGLGVGEGLGEGVGAGVGGSVGLIHGGDGVGEGVDIKFKIKLICFKTKLITVLINTRIRVKNVFTVSGNGRLSKSSP